MSLSPKKLLNSKWTAVNPMNKEKHCLVTKVELEKNGQVNHCQLQSIHSKRLFLVNWQDLKNPDKWQQGWV
jgi:tryptophan-rich hypothetical protein